jgi:hypothetical protein
VGADVPGRRAARGCACIDIYMIKAWFQRSRNRLLIWFLQLLLRVVQTPWFRGAAIRPVAYILVRIAIYRFLWAFFFNHLPKVEPNSKAAQLIADIETRMNAPVDVGASEKDRAVNQSLTWGLAGVGVVILIAIVTTQKFSPANWVAVTCLALAVPLLVMLGFVDAVLADPKRTPSIMRDRLILVISLYGVHLIFYIGFTAFLWSYDARVSLAFLIGCLLAWRLFQRFVVKPSIIQPSKTD